MREKVQGIDVEPGLQNTVYGPSFVAIWLMSKVKIAEANVYGAVRIADPNPVGLR